MSYILKIVPFIITFSLFCACENDLSEVQQFIREDQVAVEVGENVEVIYSDSGQVEVKITAPFLHRHLDKRNPKREFPKGLEIFFLDKEENVQSWLTGKYAMEYENKHLTVVRDSVVLINKNAEKLETDELTLDQANGTIYTKQFVRITTKDEQITGYGFEADQDFTYWRITAPKGRVKIDPNKLDN